MFTYKPHGPVNVNKMFILGKSNLFSPLYCSLQGLACVCWLFTLIPCHVGVTHPWQVLPSHTAPFINILRLLEKSCPGQCSQLISSSNYFPLHLLVTTAHFKTIIYLGGEQTGLSFESPCLLTESVTSGCDVTVNLSRRLTRSHPSLLSAHSLSQDP